MTIRVSAVVPDVRKNRLTGRKFRQETGERPLLAFPMNRVSMVVSRTRADRSPVASRRQSPARFLMVALGGLERTEAEYRQLFADHGFRLARVVPTAGEISVVEGVPA